MIHNFCYFVETVKKLELTAPARIPKPEAKIREKGQKENGKKTKQHLLFIIYVMNGFYEKNAIWLWTKEWRILFTSLLMLMSQAYNYSTLFYLMEDLAVNWLL